MNTGIELIAAERQRQVEQEGWSAEHDDCHQGGELSMAAASYTLVCNNPELRQISTKLWPWKANYYKPSENEIKNLVRAGALIAAEIDRLQRKAAHE